MTMGFMVPNKKTGTGPVLYLARPERFELPTAWFVARYSIQLSYGRMKGWELYIKMAEREAAFAHPCAPRHLHIPVHWDSHS